MKRIWLQLIHLLRLLFLNFYRSFLLLDDGFGTLLSHRSLWFLTLSRWGSGKQCICRFGTNRSRLNSLTPFTCFLTLNFLILSCCGSRISVNTFSSRWSVLAIRLWLLFLSNGRMSNNRLRLTLNYWLVSRFWLSIRCCGDA